MSDHVTAVVLAAGAGTRMKSRRAKVLHELGGRSMVEHALRAVREAGAARTVAVIGHDREQVAAAVSALDPAIVQAVQEEQRGTGHAVQVALASLETAPVGTVLITYGDVPLLRGTTLVELLAAHRAAGQAVTVMTAELDDPTGYGRILREADGTVRAIREDADATDDERTVREVNSGILAVDGSFLARALEELGADNAQGEMYLTDIVASAVAQGRPVGAHVLEDVWQTEGVNDRGQLARLGRELNRRTVEHWMREGVTVVDPATTWIDSAVTLEPDVTLLPGVQLLGATSVATGATVGPDSTLRNVEVARAATVVRSHVLDAVVGAEATVGPFAYLRPGSELDSRAKVGTFVETKAARIGTGAKVPHLSYVGDAEVGEGANVGAGTIVANYDGVAKHRTEVGRHARTGANNVFVAPVRIGDGAYTGGGAVIRRDVPSGSLSLSGGPQTVREGWVARERPGTPAAKAAESAEKTASGDHG